MAAEPADAPSLTAALQQQVLVAVPKIGTWSAASVACIGWHPFEVLSVLVDHCLTVSQPVAEALAREARNQGLPVELAGSLPMAAYRQLAAEARTSGRSLEGPTLVVASGRNDAHARQPAA
jgi:threonine dehydratase